MTIARMAIRLVLVSGLVLPNIALAQAAGPAVAQPARPQATTLAQVDKAKARLKKRFDAANITHDGHLTLDQARAANWKPVVNGFAKIDIDGKGYITLDELAAARARQQAQRAARAPKPAPSAVPATPPSNG